MKKIWVLTPFSIIISVLLVIACAISFFFDFRVFIFEFLISIIMLVLSIYEVFSFRRYVKNTIKSSLENLKCNDEVSIERINIPAVMVGVNGEILFYNSNFLSKVCLEQNCIGVKISSFLGDKTLEEILDHKGLDVAYGKKRYTVFGVTFENTSLLYFLDDTYYKESTREFLERKTVVGIVLFDNMEEILHDATNEQNSQIRAQVEREIQVWVDEVSGVMKRIGSGRYIVLLEERNVKKFIEEKFKILDKIRQIKLSSRCYATISIGLGVGCKSLKDGEVWARKALDMALGRGGDQVAIKYANNYSFFGGRSKAVEKFGKVRTRVISSTLAYYVQSSDNVLIMGHKFSDLDSIGASVGMWSAITNQLGKQAYIVVNKDESLGKSILDLMYANGLSDVILEPPFAEELIDEKTLLIIVDTHSPSFVESRDIYERCKNVVVIDHHRMMVDHIENAVVLHHEPSASSTCEMVTEIIQYLGEKSLGSVEAEALLSGIMLDTKNFVQKTGVRTFEAAAFLKKCGADTIKVKKMFSNSLETYKIKAQLISTVEIFDGCALTSIESDYRDIKIACAQAADELLEIQNVEASFVFYKSGDKVNISARSMGAVNVQIIMEEFGGGGHQTMAGALVKNAELREVRLLLKEKIKSLI